MRDYYSQKLATHGATPSGVDWNSAESQILRFAQVLKICDPGESFSINDYGAGYGALVDYMSRNGYEFTYRGFDISPRMVAVAEGRHGQRSNCTFVADESMLATEDYTVASGVFNVKLQTIVDKWEDFVFHSLQTFDKLSTKGFAFNMLTKYSDHDRMRQDLYYADPCFYFDYCKKRFSRNVALLHDYDLYEFTVLVRK